MNVVKLVKKAKKGDKEALLQLIMSEKDTYYRLAYSYTGNQEDALDALEDMIVILYEKIQQLHKVESFYSWSKTILVNCSKSLLLKRNKLLLIDDLNGIEHNELSSSNKEDAYRKSEQQIDLQSLLLHINDHQREAIQLKYFHDLDNQTIADITKVSLGTVKSRIFEGLKKLREKYGGDVNE
ncbi:RNA polymerase sigma factor [Paenibacillus endoradicis]|uniref:RNA polymerase sigma factor n=1 Tax=Paenibacillus endoradicis TaxID=2972487 RepID=UPI0021591ABB|nr:RNA polymerase sigma factor [Paenibacillus endoradicis]MCR8656769.1 RNA polymerase sigma factor [Paenibacillus endoradicis]